MSVSLSISDVSRSRIAGVKGPSAAEWLIHQGIEVPAKPNTWLSLAGGALIGRLAETEFFIESGPAARLASLLDDVPVGVYPVPREDLCFALAGRDIHEVLLQVCSLDFASNRAQDALFMTSMVGVPVLAIPRARDGVPVMKIWADPTFGPYLWHTLSTVIQELTGGSQ